MPRPQYCWDPKKKAVQWSDANLLKSIEDAINEIRSTVDRGLLEDSAKVQRECAACDRPAHVN